MFPSTSKSSEGLVVPIPNRLLVLSQYKLLSPVTVEAALKKVTWPATPVPWE